LKELTARREDAKEVAEHWEKEVKALRKMNELNQDHIVRFVTAFRRHKASDRTEHYLMFEWADSGNLRSLWKSFPSPRLTTVLVKDTIKQILGLAKALEAAHDFDHSVSYRHGDLKPENILVFSGSGSIGTLKIGDWGEAKCHNQVTELRPSKTTAKYGTHRYEAPEAETGIKATFLGQSTKRRSRLYDIWAMGCITLEFIIWLLYGLKGQKRFDSELGEEPFYQIVIVKRRKEAQVNKTVMHWMDHMAKDPRCQVGVTAIGDLLEQVQIALLVVKLPRNKDTGLSAGLQHTRTDSAASSQQDDIRTEVLTSEPSKSAVELPSISITPATSEPKRVPAQLEPGPERIPEQPEPETEGPSRCRAAGFRERMDQIAEEEDFENYWCFNEQNESLTDSCTSASVAERGPHHNIKSHQYYSTCTFRDSTPRLSAPAVKRVSTISFSSIIVIRFADRLASF
jgi:serine/threonine protein kinase